MYPTTEIHTIIVIPCYNEESTLANTCLSLGFGTGINENSSDAILILINNNSTDLTEFIAKKIKENSPLDTVYIYNELVQGFIPARHRGNLMAQELSISKNWDLESVLILQVDADTFYSENYISAMCQASKKYGSNVLLQACTDYSSDFKIKYNAYIDLCNIIDNKFSVFFPPALDDIVVDDKVSGYRLSDYFKWGEYHREYSANQYEIFAETTRLYIKARAHNATRRLVSASYAQHSQRKIFQNPLLHLSTAGFPREQAWVNKYVTTSETSWDLDTVCRALNSKFVSAATKTREQHIIALFIALPMHIKQTLGTTTHTEDKIFNLIRNDLPQRKILELVNQPSLFLTDVFELIERKGLLLLNTFNDYLGATS